MRSSGGSVHRLASRIGAAAIVAWALTIGPLGALCLASLYYAMLVKSVPLGIICAGVLFSPVALTIAWAPLAFIAFRRRGEEATGQVGRRIVAQTPA
ncbi:MAG: hypothetical protein FJ118_04120 [Deltaproteobacteria bacterium]|nr:hypothetical protein [Deltaproteobacteria bacterium]